MKNNPYHSRHSYWRAVDEYYANEKTFVWKKRERQTVRNERFRYIENGMIVPVFGILPQMMVKVDGVWKAEIKQG